MPRKSLLLSCFIAAISAWGQTASDLANKYSTVAAYEVRPGILMTARYAQDGQVCEMAIEKRHQTSGRVDLGSIMPRELVKEIIGNLVPANERGRATNQFAEKWDFITAISGSIAVSEADFENVSIEIDGSISDSKNAGDEVVVIRWKKRLCTTPTANHIGTNKLPLPPQGIILDEIAAVKVAEVVFPSLFGTDVVNNFLPYHAQLKDGVWTVYGTLKPGSRGGTPMMRIRKKDCKVLGVWHSG